eukprot:1767739-Alexandrium_andersonii.AAC.1
MGGLLPEPLMGLPVFPVRGTPASLWACPAGPGVLEVLRMPLAGVAQPPGPLPPPLGGRLRGPVRRAGLAAPVGGPRCPIGSPPPRPRML